MNFFSITFDQKLGRILGKIFGGDFGNAIELTSSRPLHFESGRSKVTARVGSKSNLGVNKFVEGTRSGEMAVNFSKMLLWMDACSVVKTPPSSKIIVSKII